MDGDPAKVPQERAAFPILARVGVNLEESDEVEMKGENAEQKHRPDADMEGVQTRNHRDARGELRREYRPENTRLSGSRDVVS